MSPASVVALKMSPGRPFISSAPLSPDTAASPGWVCLSVCACVREAASAGEFLRFDVCCSPLLKTVLAEGRNRQSCLQRVLASLKVTEGPSVWTLLSWAINKMPNFLHFGHWGWCHSPRRNTPKLHRKANRWHRLAIYSWFETWNLLRILG